jgi:hypothetical protein
MPASCSTGRPSCSVHGDTTSECTQNCREGSASQNDNRADSYVQENIICITKFLTPATSIGLPEWNHDIMLKHPDDKRAVRILYGCRTGRLGEPFHPFGSIENFDDVLQELGRQLLPPRAFDQLYEAELQEQSDRDRAVIQVEDVLNATYAVIAEAWRAICADDRPEGLPYWVTSPHRAAVANALEQPKPWNAFVEAGQD